MPALDNSTPWFGSSFAKGGANMLLEIAKKKE